MKYLLSISVIIFSVSNSFAITISDAIRQKLISISVTANHQSNDTTYHPSFYAACMLFKIKNLKTAPITLTEDAGRFLQPFDSTVQRMMLTQSISFALKGSEAKDFPVYAMCTEAHDHAPGIIEKFSYGEFASGKLLELVRLISKNNYQGSAAQSAIWCITDGYSPYSISGDDTVEATSLKKYVCELKGIKYEREAKYNEPELPHFREVSGGFSFTMTAVHNIDLKVYNGDGQLITTVVDAVKRTPGTYNEKYELKIPVENDQNPPSIIVKFYVDGKLFSEHKHQLKKY